MMKYIVSILLFLFTISVHAQIPRWEVHPEYNKIKLLGTGFYVVTKDGKNGMIDANEKVIIPLKYDSISPFRSHAALLFNNEKFVAYVSDTGVLKDVSNKYYQVIGLPFFSDGYVVVYNNSGYYYIPAKGGEPIGPYAEAAPFFEGYARVKVPKSQKHILDGASTNRYISANTGEVIDLPDADIEADDIDFISSSNNGKSIMVVKKRVYEYNFKNRTLTPLAMDGNTNNKKSRVFTADRVEKPEETEDGFFIILKKGIMYFDKHMRLTKIQYEGQEEQSFPIPEQPLPVYESQLKARSYPDEETKLLGITYRDVEILPAQFEEVSQLWGNEALVKKNGKYGVVIVDTNNSCHYILNGNQDLGFAHKTVDTEIKVVCPPYMKPSLMTLVSLDENCIINKDTRREVSNVESSTLAYQCTMNIPEEISLERAPSITTFSMNYDGLIYSENTLEFKTWYIFNYAVEVTKSAYADKTLDLEISVRNKLPENKIYFKDIEIEETDSMSVQITKITEETYKARILNWSGKRVIDISVVEDGCPSISTTCALDIKGTHADSQTEKTEEAEKKIGTISIKRHNRPSAQPKPKPEKKKVKIY
jgi:hypothetical protein